MIKLNTELETAKKKVTIMPIVWNRNKEETRVTTNTENLQRKKKLLKTKLMLPNGLEVLLFNFRLITLIIFIISINKKYTRNPRIEIRKLIDPM